MKNKQSLGVWIRHALFLRQLCVWMFLVVPLSVWAQAGGQQVKGQVLDSNGEPLIGVGVRNLAASTGVITDIDGFYAIGASQGDVLEFWVSSFLVGICI